METTMQGNLAYHRQIAELAAHTQRCAARRPARDPQWADKALAAAPAELNAIDRAIWVLDQKTPATIANCEAHFVRELAITYDRRKHLPNVALLIDWRPTGDDASLCLLPADRIIARLWLALDQNRKCFREYGRNLYSLSTRRLVRRAYLAERIARIRARAENAATAEQAVA
jgi:hypothetical protein